MSKFYITNAIPYVNAKPHVGHALEFVQSDVIRRFHKIKGEETLLLCGGDENAIKNVQAAESAGIPIQEFVDQNTQLFYQLSKRLNVQFDIFQKGSSPSHHHSSQKLWELCEKSGDIYKKEYTGFYCIGCELFYEENELNAQKECFEHPGKALEKVSESNYFFRLSKYQKALEEILTGSHEKYSISIVPESRKNEMLAFLRQGLEDISISRSNERAKNWGVPVPGDDSQRMYVWFDALNIYRSGLGEKHDSYWPADVHVIGKGITRFHAIYWPAFLLSAGIDLPKQIFVHGYFTVDGQKMSKSLGNVIDPVDLINEYGTDALRYYLLSQIPSTGDGDFSVEKLKTVYNADLANGIGNLVARVAKLAERVNRPFNKSDQIFYERVETSLLEYNFERALSEIWIRISTEDSKISKSEPWNKEGDELFTILDSTISEIRKIAYNLTPFLPETAEKIAEHFSQDKITAVEPLFPRIK